MNEVYLYCVNKHLYSWALLGLSGITTLGSKDKNPFNPLPYMPILDSSNSAANKDMMSKILTND